MDGHQPPTTPDPRLWRAHLIARQAVAMTMNPRLDPKMAKAVMLPEVLAAARTRFPAEYPQIAAALGAPA